MNEPTNRELKIMLDNLDGKMSEKIIDVMTMAKEIRDDVKEIKVQTIKTNGRVNKHDVWMKAFWWFFGFLGALVILMFPVLRIVEKSDIRQAVSEALSQYNIVIR